MKASILSSFISFELTPEEEIAAFSFNDCQVAGIQNQVAAKAEELVQMHLEIDQQSLDGQKKLAYTKGYIEAMKYLLAMSDVLAEQRKETEDSE